MSEDRCQYENTEFTEKVEEKNNLDKVIEENNNIFSRLTTLENKIGAMISLYRDVVVDNSMLEKRVRKLEQAQTYYPLTEEEIANIKIGGTI